MSILDQYQKFYNGLLEKKSLGDLLEKDENIKGVSESIRRAVLYGYEPQTSRRQACRQIATGLYMLQDGKRKRVFTLIRPLQDRKDNSKEGFALGEDRRLYVFNSEPNYNTEINPYETFWLYPLQTRRLAINVKDGKVRSRYVEGSPGGNLWFIESIDSLLESSSYKSMLEEKFRSRR